MASVRLVPASPRHIIDAPADQAVQSGSVSESGVGQHFNGIFSAFNDANTSLGAIQPASAARLAIRNEPVPQKHRDCANLIVVIITMVTDCLSGLLIWVLLVPKLLVWFVACDKAISLLCTGVGGILVGVLVLVKELCVFYFDSFSMG
jgi:hypothetical protein